MNKGLKCFISFLF